MFNLKKNQEAFKTTNYDLDVHNAMKKIRLNGPDMSVVILGNFDVQTGETDPNFYTTGTWYEYWTGDSIVVTDVHARLELEAGEFRLYTDKKLDTPEYVGMHEWESSGEKLHLELYPNPASSEVNLVIAAKGGDEINIVLLDLTGKKVKDLSGVKIHEGLGTYRINMDGVQPGLYFVRMTDGQQSLVRKLIIR